MRRIVFSAIGLLGAVTVGTWFIPVSDHKEHNHSHHHKSEEIDRYKVIEPFSLTDQNGEEFTLDKLEGKVWLANFVFTSCTAECPILSQRLIEVSQDLGESEDFAFVSFSVDPQTDTPQRLKQHASNFGKDPRWKLLTGNPNKLDTLIKRDFLLPAATTYHERSEIVSTNFIHSNQMVIVDDKGMVRFYYDGMKSDSVSKLSAAMQAIFQES
ncbi:SCO family protein [Puniceicoccaceae bacterium K14]|nr:SCO family protein [Puniceicoccaceae bacterium K14]